MFPGIGTLTNSGSMPIDAGGGSAGPSSASGSTNTGFRVGALNMGGGESNKTLLIIGACVVIGLLVMTRKQ